ncbi:hypothetical protein HOP50_10g58410 [Chloropicon primus]|uniref:Cilia- and flagella-associated protein 99 n=1 Tax=Chloropicon primus TaxID=1764295 RepID=A0A5B8MS72_9CHLO|nr:hypothetical protein A3770_10p58210 [Chloropicon primus]UPR02515.1 hypothetical protein HOP50_10g58410 [Chloropicon primus]|eukprot:QDZ23303.1 hypothetical protein A3770_10p58210 [Chloropicon primus]
MTLGDGQSGVAGTSGELTQLHHAEPLEDDCPKLMSLAEAMFVTFNPDKKTVDTHIDEFFKEHRINSKDVQGFLSQIFYGSIRFRKFVNVLVSSLYHTQSGNVLRNDRNMYHIYAYLALLRLSDLGFNHFRRLVLVKDAQKMLVFLKYVFNSKNLVDLCKDEWMKLYDVTFVKDVIRDLTYFQEPADDLIELLEERVFMSAQKKEEEAAAWSLGGEKKTTVPMPFKLTMTKQKAAPYEEPTYEPIKAKPAPKFLTGKTSIDVAIERAKEENKRKMKKKYENAQTFVPSVASRPSNFEKVCKEVREREESLLNFKGVKPRPVPKVPDVQVQLNVATVLRENALHQKRIEEEKKKAESYEQELRDASEFEEWQAQMKRLDEENRRKEIERRRKEMGKIAKKAMDAQKLRIETNREEAHGLKQLLRSLGEQHKQDIESIEVMNKESRARVINDRGKVAMVRSKMKQERMSNAYSIKSEQALNLDKIAEYGKQELAQKKKLIEKVKVPSSVPREVKTFDPTKTAELGLLDEMPLTELHERLKLEREAAQEEERNRRAKIRLMKMQRSEKLSSLLAENTQFRKIASIQGAARRTHKVEKEKLQINKEREKLEKSMMKTYSRLKEKQTQRNEAIQALKKEEQEILAQQQSQAATKGAVEEKKFRELTMGAEREIKLKQVEKKKEALIYEATKVKENRIKMAHVQREKHRKKEALDAYDAYVKTLAELRTAEIAKETKMKRMKASTIRNHEKELRSQLSSRSTLFSRQTLNSRESGAS